MKNSQAIGIFDSGIGGFTVMKQIMQKLPYEQLIYFGDTARLPYGEKSPEIILRYSTENAIFLMKHKIKLLVIACNTASAYAVDELSQILSIPVIGVIKPGAEHAAATTRSCQIAVLATRATTFSGVYPSEIRKRLPHADVHSIACPLLVPLIEEHFFDHLATKLILKEYLAPIKQKNIDTLLLGCTHYPLLQPIIQDEIGADVTIIDSASTCAEQVLAALEAHGLRNLTRASPIHQYYASDDPEKFRRHGSQFLGHIIDKVDVPSKMQGEHH